VRLRAVGEDDVRTAEAFDARIRAYLDTRDHADVVALLMAPAMETRIHVTPGAPKDPEERADKGRWLPGDPRPGLADEDPGVIAAMGRCATARWRGDARFGDLARTEMHPERCGWCDYPAPELMRALDWASHYGRLIEAEAYVWRRGSSSYRRDSGRAGLYENPAWQTFATLPPKEQRYLVDRAVEASRANLSADPEPPIVPRPNGDRPTTETRPTRDHLPWCDLRPDHAGDCPAPPEEEAS